MVSSEPIRILLVEDDQVDRMACRRAFAREPEQYEFLEAETGREGLELARGKLPHCVLLDYRLPDTNGLDVLAQFAAAGLTPPVIMLTGAMEVSVAVDAMRRGARDYVLKDQERHYLELLPRIVDRVLQEQRLAEDKHRAETALAHAHRLMTAGELTATIAHELSQPLAAISTFSEACLQLLNRADYDSKKLRANIEQISAQAQRAGRAIRDLRAFLVKGDTTKTAVDLNDLARTASGLMAAEAKARGVRLVLDLAQPLPPVMAASLHIEHVLVNLMQNSIEAMRGSAATGRSVTVSTRETNNMAQVTVHDTGPGVDLQTAPQIFEPLYTTKAEGLGMGLAISRKLIDAHGGKLWMDPTRGSGATFHFTIPFA